MSKTLRERINEYENNVVFGYNDFLDYGNYDSIRKALIRLSNSGVINRLIDGVYYKPKYSSLTNERIPVRIEDVAEYMASRYGWNIVPCEELALNYIGLSEQVPSKYVYLSTGPYRKYQIENRDLSFKHTANRNLFNMSYDSALLIQGIKGIGKDKIQESDIKIIKKRFSKESIDKAIAECKNVPTWIYETIKRIGREYD